MEEEQSVSHKVIVGEQTFKIRIHPEERAFYDRVSDFTEQTFREIIAEGVTGGPEAWAMTAFQIACDLIESRGNQKTTPESQARIERLIRRIEDVTANT